MILLLVVLLQILVLLVGLAVFVLLLVLLIHNEILPFRSPRCGYRIPGFSGFILGPEEETCQQPRHDGSGDTPRRSGKAAGEDAQKAFFIDGLPAPLCQGVAEARQGDRGPAPGEIHQRLVKSHGA